MKYTCNALLILSILWLTTVFNSCKKDYVTEEPEIVYDQGERLVLNDNVIVLENSSMTHDGQQGVLFDEATGVMQFDEACELGVVFELDTGAVLHINMEQKALVRKVTGVETNSGKYILQTEKSSIHDVYDNAEVKFDFSPDFSNEQLSTKSISNLSQERLSEALTDESGRIHPSEMYIMEGDKKITLFSVKDNMPLKTTKSVNAQDGKVGFEHQFNTQFYVPGLPITVGLEDFGFSLYTNLKADYSIKKHTRSFNTHLPFIGKVSAVDGVTSSFVVDAEDTEISLWADLGVEATGAVPVVDEDVPLFDPKVLGFVFPVGCVPTHIHIECELVLELDFELGGEVKVVNGLELTTTLPKIEVGSNFSAIYKDWHVHHSKPYVTVDFDHKYGAIHSFETPNVKLEQRPIRYEAMAKFVQNFSIRPSLGFSIDDMAGPEIAIPVHAINTLSMGAGESISVTDTTEAPKGYIGWGSALGTKVGLKAGIWLDFLGFANKHLDIPEIPLTPEIPVWHTPGSMNLLTDNDFSKTVVGQEKEVEVKVEDFFTLPAPLMFVVWEGGAGGTWKYPVTVTGVTGKTTNTYTPTSIGDHEPYCSVKNGNLIEKGKVTFTTTTLAQ